MDMPAKPGDFVWQNKWRHTYLHSRGAIGVFRIVVNPRDRTAIDLVVRHCSSFSPRSSSRGLWGKRERNLYFPANCRIIDNFQ